MERHTPANRRYLQQMDEVLGNVASMGAKIRGEMMMTNMNAMPTQINRTHYETSMMSVFLRWRRGLALHIGASRRGIRTLKWGRKTTLDNGRHCVRCTKDMKSMNVGSEGILVLKRAVWQSEMDLDQSPLEFMVITRRMDKMVVNIVSGHGDGSIRSFHSFQLQCSNVVINGPLVEWDRSWNNITIISCVLIVRVKLCNVPSSSWSASLAIRFGWISQKDNGSIPMTHLKKDMSKLDWAITHKPYWWSLFMWSSLHL